MKIATIFSILLLLHITSYLVSAQIIDILLGPIINLLNSILGSLLISEDTRKLAQILSTIKREYNVELSNEEIIEKVKHFLQLKTDINGEWDFDMTVQFFLPEALQLKLGGGSRWLAEGEDPNGKFEEGEIGAGPPIAEPRIKSEVLEETHSKGDDNEKDHHIPEIKEHLAHTKMFLVLVLTGQIVLQSSIE